MKILIRCILLFFLVMLISVSLFAQASAPINDTLALRFKTVLDEQRVKYDLHGISSAVIIPNYETWLGVSGESHPGYPMEPDMLFYIASITKTFAAAVILQLAEEGVLSLNDSLHQWLPSYPYIDSTITIRQLLNHTSGIFNLHDHGSYADSMYNNPDKYWTPEETILTFIDKPYFSPGTEGEWHYSNTNYLLIGMIIEQATQSDLATEMQNRVADPLQLDNIYFAWNDTINDYCAHPWLSETDDALWAYQAALTSTFFGSANFISTAEDIAKWGKHLFEADIFTQVTLDQMLTFTSCDLGTLPYKTGYGLGVQRFTMCNRILYGHSGGLFGYTNQLIYSPKDSLSIAVFIPDGDIFEARESITTELLAWVLSFIHGYPKLENNISASMLTINLDWASAVDTSLCVYNRGWGKDTIDISIDYGMIDTTAISVETSSFELAPGDSQFIKLIMVPNKINNWSNFKVFVDSKFNYLVNPIEVSFTIMDPIDKPWQNLPNKYALYQNYPNPFNPKTVISWQVGATSMSPLQVDLSIYNVLGQKVATLVSGKQKAGFYEVEWDAGGFASGVYYYRLQAGEYVDCKKLVLLK